MRSNRTPEWLIVGHLARINRITRGVRGLGSPHRSKGEANTSNEITSFSYDAVGNTLNDTHNAYLFNAESEIKTGAGIGYTYDGDGNRIEKSSGKIYWYGAGTEVLDESSSSGTFTDEYVFVGGKRIAHRVISGNAITYYGEDFLGTARQVYTSASAICYDADFYPFGGERAYTSICADNYKFEDKKRDQETGNDDFGARYYTSSFGRWESPDWSSTPAPVPYANLTNPQTLNLYAMVRDNPESFADLDGHEDGSDGTAVAAPAQSDVNVKCLNPPSCTKTSQTLEVHATLSTWDKIKSWFAGGASGAAGGGTTLSGVNRLWSTRALRRGWEKLNGRAWPKDPETGRNQEFAHHNPVGDGAPDGPEHGDPMTHSDHVRSHSKNDDFARWGARASRASGVPGEETLGDGPIMNEQLELEFDDVFIVE